MPTWLALPAFLAATSYQNPIDPLHGAFQTPHHTPLTAFRVVPPPPLTLQRLQPLDDRPARQPNTLARHLPILPTAMPQPDSLQASLRRRRRQHRPPMPRVDIPLRETPRTTDLARPSAGAGAGAPDAPEKRRADGV
jgi:hypothetical protein